MKAVVAAFNQEKALVGAFSVITNLRMDHFEALMLSERKQEEETSGNTRDTACQVKVNFVFTNFCQETSLMF